VIDGAVGLRHQLPVECSSAGRSTTNNLAAKRSWPAHCLLLYCGPAAGMQQGRCLPTLWRATLLAAACLAALICTDAKVTGGCTCRAATAAVAGNQVFAHADVAAQCVGFSCTSTMPPCHAAVRDEACWPCGMHSAPSLQLQCGLYRPCVWWIVPDQLPACTQPRACSCNVGSIGPACGGLYWTNCLHALSPARGGLY
jgi:hypothetical protein